MVNVECEPRDSSVSFTLFSSLIHSRHFILNLKIKKNHFQPAQFTPRKLILRIIKITCSWDRDSSPQNLFYNRFLHLLVQ